MEKLKSFGIWITKHAAIVGAGIIALWLWEQYRTYNKQEVTNTVTKEKTVKEIHHYNNVPNTQPIIIRNQITLDSSFRKQTEHETINTGVKEHNGVLTVQSVDTNGKVSEKDYKVPEGTDFTLTNKGLTLIKTPFYKNIKIYAGGQIGFNQNGLTNISPQLIITSPAGMAINGSYNFIDNSKTIGLAHVIRFKKR